MNEKKSPIISIGMPVFNDLDTISKAIDTLLSQSFTDFELIISDNCSTDGTEDICRRYAEKDSRIRYVRQDVNLGSDNNIKFVYKQAQGEFFMWAPAHYSRNSSFIKDNLRTLQENPNCSFAATSNCWLGDENSPEKWETFTLEGPLYKRVMSFFDHSWGAHACFYSLFRHDFLEDYPDLSCEYLAADWMVMLHLLFKGEFLRPKNGLLVIGRGGSTKPDYLSSMRTRPVHYIFPLFDFSVRAFKLIFYSEDITTGGKLTLSFRIFWLNVTVQVMLVKNGLSQIMKLFISGKKKLAKNVRDL